MPHYGARAVISLGNKHRTSQDPFSWRKYSLVSPTTCGCASKMIIEIIISMFGGRLCAVLASHHDSFLIRTGNRIKTKIQRNHFSSLNTNKLWHSSREMHDYRVCLRTRQWHCEFVRSFAFPSEPCLKTTPYRAQRQQLSHFPPGKKLKTCHVV